MRSGAPVHSVSNFKFGCYAPKRTDDLHFANLPPSSLPVLNGLSIGMAIAKKEL